MTDNQNWLAEYVQTGSDTAFRELVTRYVDLVYSTALRLVGGDTHRAEDVAQIVFVNLARVARTLPKDVKLGGWLHRDTCFAASTLMRGERRRQSRERQAVEMNALQNNSEVDYALIAPVLDEAINELEEADRTAILLRFFEQHDFRTVGEVLGSNEDAARMRVNRALEKLEGFLKRRGVTTTAASLGVVLSTNAIQAAPAGLVVTISTAATLAGTAIATTTTATAIKTIAMTTLQKTLIAAALIVAAGTGIYEASQVSRLREENQTLQQQQTPLATQLQQLQRAHDEATNRLAAVNAEMAQLKSAQNQAELLKLRGQVGTLRQQLVSTESKTSTPATGISKMMSDPAMKELIHQAQLDLIKSRYTALFQELKLTPEQTDKFIQMMGDIMLKHTERISNLPPETANQTEVAGALGGVKTELGDKLKSVLGEAGYARFNEFTEEIPAQATVKLLNGQLGGNPLNDDQRARLFQIVKAEPFDLTHGISGDLDKAFFGSQEDIDNYLLKVTESNQRVIQQAGNFLAPDQLAALNTVLTNGINARITQAAALVQKH